MTHARILLADCDAMFVAVARMVDPEGAGASPLLVVGGRRGGRGVVCSASYEARQYGVRSGMPIGQAERLCPAAMFVPVPRRACHDKSREVRAVLEEWSPVVEQASVDEFYLGLAGTGALYRHEELAVTAARIRQDVLARTGLTVSIGGGTNRLVAKLAVERAKPRPGTGGTGIHIVPEGEETAFVAGLALADIPGVGPRLSEALRRYGLTWTGGRSPDGSDRGPVHGSTTGSAVSAGRRCDLTRKPSRSAARRPFMSISTPTKRWRRNWFGWCHGYATTCAGTD